MDENEYRNLFLSANKYLYRYTLGRRKRTNVLTETEKVIFKKRFIYLFDTLGLKLGYWGIFSLAFEGIPGYCLANYFRKTDEYNSDYYELVNGFKRLKPCFFPQELPKIDTIKTLVDREILPNSQLIQIMNDLIPVDPVGISNCCNTCYISVSLQLLCHYDKFIKLLMDYLDKSRNDFYLARIIIEIFFSLVTGKDNVSIEKLLDYLSIDPTNAEDAFEFLYKIIDRLHDEGCRQIKELFYISNNLIFPAAIHSKNFSITGFKNLIKTFTKFPDLIVIQIEKPTYSLNLHLIPSIINKSKYNLYGLFCYTSSNKSGHYYIFLSEEDKYMKLDDETTETFQGLLIKHKFSRNELIVGIVLLKEGVKPIKSRIVSESSWSYLYSNINEFPIKKYQTMPIPRCRKNTHSLEQYSIRANKNTIQDIQEIALTSENENTIQDIQEIALTSENENTIQDIQEIALTSENENTISSQKIKSAFQELYSENVSPCLGDDEFSLYSKSLKTINVLIHIDKYDISDVINQLPDQISAHSIRTFELFIRIVLAIVDIRPFYIELYAQMVVQQIHKVENNIEFSFSIVMNQIMSNFTIERSYFLYVMLDKLEYDQILLNRFMMLWPMNDLNVDSYTIFLPELKTSNVFNNWLLLKHINISERERIVDEVNKARQGVNLQNARFLPDLVLMISENRTKDFFDYISMFNIDPLTYKLDTPLVNTFSILKNRPTILQLAIMFNSKDIVDLIISNWPNLRNVLDDDDLSISDYSLIFSRIDIAHSLQIEFEKYLGTNLKMRYLSNNPTLLEYRIFFSTYVMSSIEEVKSRPDFQMINNLLLSSQKEAEDLIKLYAASNGFSLIQETSNKNYKTFHCWKGGRSKGAVSNKCGCLFKVNLSIHKDGKTIIKVINTHHNHKIDPTLFQHYLLPASTKQLIKVMISANIIPDAVCRFIEQYSNVILIPQQIAKIVAKETTPVEISQTIELIDYMHLTGGKYYTYTRNEKILAILTITEDEIINMKYADVVYTDGSCFSNKLGWKFHPITGQNGNLETVLFGVLFSGTFDGDVAKWFLKTLFFDTPLGDIAKTLITDEDSSIVSVLDDLSSEICAKLNHIINYVFCAWHKTKNFKIHLGLQGDSRIAALELWNKYIYHKNEEESTQAYHELLTIVSKKTKDYLEQYVKPIENHIRACSVKRFLTFGHNTTGISENINRQSKRFLRLKFYSLMELRREITRISKKSKMIRAYRIDHQYNIPDYINEQLQLKMFVEPKNILMGSINKSFRLEGDLIDGKYVVTDNLYHTSEIVTEIEDCITCTCCKSQNYGLPCSHLIFYYREKCDGKFPLEDINGRFVQKKYPLLTKPNFQELFSVDDIIPSNNDNIQSTQESAYSNYMKMTSEFSNLATYAKSSATATKEVLGLIKKTLEKLTNDQQGDFDATSGRGERKMRRIQGSYET